MRRPSSIDAARAELESKLRREGLAPIEGHYPNHRGVPHDDGRDWRVAHEFGETPPHRLTAAELLAQGAELRERREGFLQHYQFRSKREKRIYRLHTAGHSTRWIAARLQVSLYRVLTTINRVERSLYSDAVVPVRLARIWHYWLQGWDADAIARRCRTTQRRVRQVVERTIREWRRTPPAEPAAFVPDCDPEFVRKLGGLTTEAVLEAAKNDPEIAAMVARLSDHRG